MKKRILSLFAFILVITPTVSVGKTNYLSSNVTDKTDEHLIEGVPYVGQDKQFFCHLASFTMVVKYYGINTTFEEVLYYAGNGYWQLYLDFDELINMQRIPYHMVSPFPNFVKFLTEQYGLSYELWETNINVSFEERWNHDWPRIKENISNNIPVIFMIDELILMLDYLGFENIENLVNIFDPPEKDHFIVLVGFNENNNSICIQDPAYLIMDKPELGTYRWTNLDLIKFAHSRCSPEQWGGTNLVKIFKKDKNTLSKEEAFIRAHNRSIELLKGNQSIYFPDYDNEILGDCLEDDSQKAYFGTTGTKKHIQHCSMGLENRTKTMSIYKKHGKLGITKTLKDIFFYFYSKIFPEKNFLEFYKLENTNNFEHASLSKQYVIRYLSQAKDFLNDSNLRYLCEYELEMFKSLEKKWEILGHYYSIFLRKGIFTGFIQGNILMNKMKEKLEEIVTIEEAIIAGSSEE
ncbi:MAG: C39 family peptidase [Thermoplasmatales archaeon]|nr:MAG: C39 family peptidase [Thermoplasmatales archaeon]